MAKVLLAVRGWPVANFRWLPAGMALPAVQGWAAAGMAAASGVGTEKAVRPEGCRLLKAAAEIHQAAMMLAPKVGREPGPVVAGPYLRQAQAGARGARRRAGAQRQAGETEAPVLGWQLTTAGSSPALAEALMLQRAAAAMTRLWAGARQTAPQVVAGLRLPQVVACLGRPVGAGSLTEQEAAEQAALHAGRRGTLSGLTESIPLVSGTSSTGMLKGFV